MLGDMENSFLSVRNMSYMLDIHSTLRGISFDLKQGDNIVFFGLENSGIDKICPFISCAIDDFDGDVFFKGHDVKNASYFERNIIRKDMVYLQRGYGLITNMTVYENIALPLRYHSKMSSDEIDFRVNQLIDEMEIDLSRDMRPVDIYQSERLKTAFARAIALNPDLLLAEHPLEAQCVLNVMSVMRSLKKWADSPLKSVIIVAYNPAVFSDIANRFIMLYRGEVVFDGTREEFLSTTNEYVVQYMTFSPKGPMMV